MACGVGAVPKQCEVPYCLLVLALAVTSPPSLSSTLASSAVVTPDTIHHSDVDNDEDRSVPEDSSSTSSFSQSTQLSSQTSSPSLDATTSFTSSELDHSVDGSSLTEGRASQQDSTVPATSACQNLWLSAIVSTQNGTSWYQSPTISSTPSPRATL